MTGGVRKKMAMALLAILVLSELTVGVFAQGDQSGFIDEADKAETGEELRQRRQKAKEECQVEQDHLTQSLNELQGGVPLPAAPVSEVGELLTVAKKTKVLSGEIRELTDGLKSLQIQICTHLKVIRDMQLAMEEKEFKFDPDARKANARAIHEHQNRIIELFRTGYKTSEAVTGVSQTQSGDDEGQGQPLQPVNLNEHLKGVAKETYAVFVDDLKKAPEGQMPFKQDILRASEVSEAERKDPYAAFKASSGWTRERFDRTISGQSENFWDDFILISQPQNNPYGAFFLAQNELGSRQQAAAEGALNEYAAGGGILPIRKCKDGEKTEDQQACRVWETLTSGSVVKDYLVAILLKVLRQAEVSDENLEDFLQEEFPNLEERLKNLVKDQEEDQSVFDEEDPCPGPGPCEDSGFGQSQTAPQPQPPGQQPGDGGQPQPGSGGQQPPAPSREEYGRRISEGLDRFAQESSQDPRYQDFGRLSPEGRLSLSLLLQEETTCQTPDYARGDIIYEPLRIIISQDEGFPGVSPDEIVPILIRMVVAILDLLRTACGR